MTYVSMAGPGSVGETAGFLRKRLTEKFALVGEKPGSRGKKRSYDPEL